MSRSPNPSITKASLDVIGESFEDVFDRSGLFAGFDRGAEQRRKCIRKLVQRMGEGVALDDAGTHAERNALDAFGFALLGYGGQRFVERQAGAQDRKSTRLNSSH